MRQIAIVTLFCAALYSQDQPPAAAPPPTEPQVLRSTGKPIVVPFQCTPEDIHAAGLTCSEQDPCPVYLEVAEVESTGSRLFATGNIHSATATLYSILLGSDDNGLSWREAHERIHNAGLDHLQFSGADSGWAAGLTLAPLPRDPFLLQTTDGGKTWRHHPIFNEPTFGAIQQFYFEDKTSGTLIIDHGAGSDGDRYELYESKDGGESWNIKQTSVTALRLKLPPAPPAPEYRVRADGPTKSFHLEHRQGQRWTSVASFAVSLGVCKPE